MLPTAHGIDSIPDLRLLHVLDTRRRSYVDRAGRCGQRVRAVPHDRGVTVPDAARATRQAANGGHGWPCGSRGHARRGTTRGRRADHRVRRGRGHWAAKNGRCEYEDFESNQSRVCAAARRGERRERWQKRGERVSNKCMSRYEKAMMIIIRSLLCLLSIFRTLRR